MDNGLPKNALIGTTSADTLANFSAVIMLQGALVLVVILR